MGNKITLLSFKFNDFPSQLRRLRERQKEYPQYPFDLTKKHKTLWTDCASIMESIMVHGKK